MRDPLRWLNRPILGEDLAIEDARVAALHRRAERKTVEARVRAPRPAREARVRPVQRKVAVGPYAPQQIRLVRRPYTQAVTRGRRVRFVQPREARLRRLSTPWISESARRDLQLGAPVFSLPRPRFGARLWARGLA